MKIENKMQEGSAFHKGLFISTYMILIYSGLNPQDRFTWFLEVFPVIIGSVAFLVTYKNFRFTNLVYMLVWVHACILIIGGHYTYAEMPLFNWLKDTFELSRNYYDRLGHLVQGIIPTIVIREYLIRNKIVNKKGWMNGIVICICLAISATYELIEFAVARLTGESATAFLGTQGDIWDTQWDMLLALIGSIFSTFTIGKYHDRILKKLSIEEP